MTEDEMVGWHHQLNGHEFEQPLGDGEGQGSPPREAQRLRNTQGPVWIPSLTDQLEML